MNAFDLRRYLARSQIDALSPVIFPERYARARERSAAPPPFGYLLPHGHPIKTAKILRSAVAQQVLPEVVVYLATSHYEPTPYVLPCAVRTYDGEIPTVIDWLDGLPSRLLPAVAPFERDHSWRQDLPFFARQAALAKRPLRQLSILVGSLSSEEIRTIMRHLLRVAWECFSHVTFIATGDMSHVGERFGAIPGSVFSATRADALSGAIQGDAARLKMLAERRADDFSNSMGSSSACARKQAVALAAEAPVAGSPVPPSPICFFQGAAPEMRSEDWFYVAGAVRFPALPRPPGALVWDAGDAMHLRGLFGDVALEGDAAALLREGSSTARSTLRALLRQHALTAPSKRPLEPLPAPPVVRWSSGSQGEPRRTEHSRESVVAQARHARATHRRPPATVRLARPANLLERVEYESGEYWFEDKKTGITRVSPGVDPAAVADDRWLAIGERLAAAGTRALHGEPGYLAGLAGALNGAGRALTSLLHVEVGHGPLPLAARAALRRAFPLARVDTMYHTSEFGPVAVACPRGVLHLQEGRLRGARGPGRRFGELLITDDGPTTRTPRTNFQTGDLIEWAPPCACGAYGRPIRFVGRASEHAAFAALVPRGGRRRLEQALVADGVGPLYRFDLAEKILFVPPSAFPGKLDRTEALLLGSVRVVSGIPATTHPAKYAYYRLATR